MTAQIYWTKPAEKELDSLPDHPRFRGNKRAWHERKVRRDAARNMPHATRARIRKPTHIGGVRPDEREHITVTYKLGNKDLGARHVYTDVDSDSDSESE